VDLVASSRDPGSVTAAFVSLPGVAEVVARGETWSSVRLLSGPEADLRVVSDAQFPFALLHFTGSREHNVAMRARALRRGMTLSEDGLFRGGEPVSCSDEGEIFARLGLAFIPPELREDQGEIEAAEKGEIPRLVEWEDLKGVLHVHTSASDGSATLEEMAEAARDLGMTYLGICDHSKAARYAGGLDEGRVEEQHRAIDVLNRSLRGITLLKGIEADILADGTLDFTDDVLARFDFVVASVHSRFNLPEPEMTRRIVRAVSNRHVRILGHPTGRLLLAREPYPVDLKEVFRAAAGNGVCMELNAHPHRLDLDWRMIPEAKTEGLRISINPDAHDPGGLADMRHGIGIARKGGLGRDDVLNTLDLPGLMEVFRR
jgi:DNA polymerase (family 10)